MKPLRRVGMAAQNALEIIRYGRLTAPYGAPFEVVHEDRVHRLRHYQGAASAPAVARSAPLLLVPPLMVASEVYDIAPDISAVAALVREGIDVWLVDFGAPEREAGGMERTLDDHVRAVSEAVDRVRAAAGRDLHLAGYSQGGMFAYQAAALRRAAGLASVITFGSPVDIHQNAGFSDAVAERLIDLLRSAVAFPLDRTDGLPGLITSTGFRVLSARKELGQLYDFVRKLHDRDALEQREARRLFLRGQGFVAWPGPALRKFVDEVIVANRLATGGFVIDEKPVTLADITCPILCFVGERDDMARPAAVRAIRQAAPQAELVEIDVRAGHFGLVVGSTALAVTWPTVIDWIRWRDQGAPAAERPARLGAAGAAAADSDDLELVADVAGSALSALRDRVVDRARSLAAAAARVRTQVPRLERLRRMTPETRVSVGRELAEQAARNPARTFFVWRGRAFTVGDADTRVNHVVRGLAACGLRLGQQVGVFMSGRPSYLTTVAALSRLGAVSVLIDPRAADDDLRRALAAVELSAVLADPEHAARAAALFAGPGPVLVLGGGGQRRDLGLGDRVVDLEAINPDAVKLPAWYVANPGRAADLAMIILSQSRAGEPRPARVSNQRWAFSALGAAASCTLTDKDTVYSCLPLHHAAGTMVAAGSALVSGARLALADGFDAAGFWPEVRRYGATVVFYAGEMLRPLVDAPRARGENNHPVRLFAGSGLRVDLWRRLVERFGPVGVMEFYASTETNAVLANASGEKVGAVGRPIPGSAEMAVVRWDAATASLVRDRDGWCVRAGAGETGMLLARWGGAAGAPVGSAHAPLKRMVRGAFAAGDVWYLTGDLLRVDADGDHWFVERAADVILGAAGPVLPGEIEDALYRGTPAAYAAAYAAAGAPVTAIELRAGAGLDAAELTAALAALGASARPRVVRALPSLPLTDGFRPLRSRLRAEGVPDALAPGERRFVWSEARRSYEEEGGGGRDRDYSPSASRSYT